MNQYNDFSGKVKEFKVYAGNRVIGVVRGETFYKSVRSSVHFLREPRGICFDVSSLKDAEDFGARRVEVTDKDTGRTYATAISTVWARGFTLNRGYGEQVALVLKHWQLNGGETAIQNTVSNFRISADITPTQLTLI